MSMCVCERTDGECPFWEQGGSGCAYDAELREELALWDATLMDGLEEFEDGTVVDHATNNVLIDGNKLKGCPGCTGAECEGCPLD